jgi:MFS family permease
MIACYPCDPIVVYILALHLRCCRLLQPTTTRCDRCEVPVETYYAHHSSNPSPQASRNAQKDGRLDEGVQLVWTLYHIHVSAANDIRYISLVAASCMVLYGYDASVFNALQNSKNWVAYYDNPSPNIIGAINTSYTVGAVVAGFFMGGPLADWAGRRVGMAAGAMLVIVATFMQTFAPHGKIGVFIAGRVIIGIGQGLALTAGSIYIGELSPPEIRGKIMSFWQMFYSVGSFIAYWVSFATSKHPKGLGEWDWKMVVIFQLLVPVLILSQVFFIPESPRWYVQHGRRYEDARQSLRRVRPTDEEVEEEITTIREAIEFEAEAISSGYSALWKDKSVRKRMIIAMIINGGQQITGQGTLNSYSSIIYKKVFKSSDTVALINALNATFSIIFTLNATWTVDRFGRKFLFIVGGIGMGLCMIIAATVETQTPSPGGAKTQPVGIAIVFLMFLFALFCKSSLPILPRLDLLLTAM